MADTGAAGPKRIRTKEQEKAKRESDRARAKTRVNLGFAFKGWRELRQLKGMKTDPELALFLLNSYTKGPMESTPSNHASSSEPVLSSSMDTDYDQDRAGEALSQPLGVKHKTFVDADEMVHGETPSEHQEEVVFEFPEPVAVQHEDDLIGKSACIAYEECLRKLAEFLQLPIRKCPHADPITDTKCGCVSPFQVEISRNGTAFIMEWCCSNGHSLWKWNSQPLLKFGMQSGDFMLSTSILLSGNSYTKVALLFKHMNMGMVVDTTPSSVQDASVKDFWQRKRAEVLARLKEKDSETVCDFPAGVQQLQMKEEPTWQQEWSCSLHQEDTKPQHTEEGQDGEQLQGLEDADTKTLPFNVVAVKNEDDEELYQRETDQMETGADEEDCGGPESNRISHPESYSAPEIEVQIEESSETETADSDECPWTREKQSGLSSVKIYSCSECGERFTLKHHLIRHRVVHTGEKPFCCSDCGKRFVRINDLTHHIANHKEEEKPFSCCECGKRFNRKYNLLAHTLQHTKHKSFSCSKCNKRYSDKRRLARHMRSHVEGKPFSCSECGKKFKLKHILTRHMGMHTGEKPFSCSECGKQFKRQYILTGHMRIHTGEKPFICSECGKQFQHKYVLTSHMKIHTGEKPFSCSECRKQFKHKFILTRHMKIHSEEKPFSCSECGKRFNQKSDLTRHKKSHTRDTALSCSECGKQFRSEFLLAGHMLVHTGEKPFSCSECSKSFYREWHLTSHMLVHTGKGEKRYSCSVCGQRFSLCSQLKKHECVSGPASELHQNQITERMRDEAETGNDGDTCGGSLQERSSDLERLQQPEAEIQTDFYDL